MIIEKQEVPDPNNNKIRLTAQQVLVALLGLFLLNLLLRVFYIRYDFVNGDEGVRALTATRMLEGARLYAEVVTDKPPGASLFYATVFALFGRSMKAVHLAAIVWNFATCTVVYLIGWRFHNKRIGLWAALFFVYFSTNYFTQDTMAANTELLMVLPYSAAFYFFISGRISYREDSNRQGSQRSAYAALIIAGLMTGLAAMFKQIGVLNLVFFTLYEILAATHERWKAGVLVSVGRMLRRGLLNLLPIGVGFISAVALFVLWLKSIRALGDFWHNAFLLNMFYIDSEPFGLWIKFMAGRGLGYLLFNAVLWSLSVLAIWRSLPELIKHPSDQSVEESKFARMDLAVTLWGAVSLIGVVLSGRFYGHYFIPTLPALCLLAARGAKIIREALNQPAHRRNALVGLAILILFFLVGFFRCHHRTAVLAFETVTGTRTRWSGNWGMTRREEEAETVSRYVRERIPEDEPLYIWGYAHDVFWRTGCRPASRYLTPYYIDGRFADAEDTVPSSGEEFRFEAAANLLEDLRRARPRLILDVGGGFKALPYQRLVDFIDENYADEGSVGIDGSRPFRALRLKSEEEKQTEEIERHIRKESRRQRSGL